MGFVTKYDKDKTVCLFMSCDCSQEILRIEYDYDLELADLSMYQSLSTHKHHNSWFNKIRYIFRILTNSNPYEDQMVLSKKSLKELKDFLNSVL